MVDSTTSCELLSFLDAYSGYHQISLAINDEEKTAFITPFGIFCYTKMVFRFKNGGATYQMCIHIILEPQIGRNVEAYIDDVVVKSKKHGDLLDDLKETFNNLCKYKMMLNPEKMCVWRIIRKTAWLHGIILGDRREPKEGGNHQTNATTSDSKKIQKLAGMMAALSRFISRLGECGISFYKLLRKADVFQWDDQATMTFIELK
jgi:hypothetical protein